MPEPAGPGDGLIRGGIVTSLLGMALSLVSLLPLVTSIELPSLLWALSMLTGLGIALILLGLASKGRRRARVQRAARVPLD